MDRIGKVSSESVKKHTGKDWKQWITLLDKTGAKNWPHRELVVLLRDKYKLTPWWQQGVAMGYEIHHGRRVEGRNEKGLYSLAATKTVELSQREAWDFLESEKGLAIWLAPFAPFPFEKGAVYEVEGGVHGEVRTVKAPQRLRLSWIEETWAKPSVVQLGVNKRPGKKCLVTLIHEGIPGEAEKLRLRERWKKALVNLAATAR